VTPSASAAARLLAILLVAAGAWADEDGGPVRENRLAGERSPYLRQHRTNPVDWYPWGEEAFARARAEGRPVFLSVGYAACHWCHVMEHESFEDPATAEALNAAFVCVKVDREERPDVDALYMAAVHLISGRGGWPMTVLLTPEKEPFWAGTYLRPQQVRQLAAAVGAEWRSRPERLRAQAARVTEALADLADGVSGRLPAFEGTDTDLLRVLDGALAASFDAERGGYGGRPKFPPHGELLYLLDQGGRRGGEEGLRQARRTLTAMADGGIHDQVGGGFHRYSTDAEWLLPHFEKMLYDNALLAQAYAGLFAVTQERRHADVARGILAWVRRDLARPGGGYASSLDADTEGEEGLTYTWTPAELAQVLGREEGAFAAAAWGVTPAGNFADEATGRRTGRSVLHRPAPLGADGEARLERLRGPLLAARGRRPQPGLDDKVITAWNGLLLSAFARVAQDLGDPEAREDGRRLAAFLLERCRREDGTLLRFPRGSGPEIAGFAEDHVHLAQGLLDLAEATGEARWGEAAGEVADRLLRGFEDPDHGGFFTTSGSHEALLTRRKETMDSPIPSDNGVAARVLLRLATRTGEARWREAADRTLSAWRPLLAEARSATFVTALYRALADRLALDASGGTAGPPPDATAEKDPVRVDAWLERDVVRLGGRVAVTLRLRLAAGWHVNGPSLPEGSTLIPTRLSTAPGAPAVLATVDWPAPVPGEGPDAVAQYAGEVWARARLEVPDGVPRGPRRVVLVLRAQPCNAVSCLAPVDLEVPLSVRYADADGPPRPVPHAGR
jgi:uncharacterized protein YyaL (SSP411 family)